MYPINTKYYTVNLAVASWNSSTKSQTVSCAGISADEDSQEIFVSANAASGEDNLTAFDAAGVYISGIAEGKITFTCFNVPTVAIKVDIAVQQVDAPPVVSYITFSSPESFTLAVGAHKKYWNGTIEYSIDTKDWSVWDGITTLSSGLNNKLYIRGINNTKITGVNESYNVRWRLTGSNISCDGNIEMLLDYQTVLNGEHPAMASYCYAYLFYESESLITAPELPAVTLTDFCYNCMFADCPLTVAPELPATTLTKLCYSAMFRGCASLATLPMLPATTLATQCYEYMFYNCPKIKLSKTKTGTYTQEYRIPTNGTGTGASLALTDMFGSTGGTFTGTPTLNTTYYLDESNSIVPPR